MKAKPKKAKNPPRTIDEARTEEKRTEAVARAAKERVRSTKSRLKAAKKALKADERAAKKARKEAKRASKALKVLVARQRARKKKQVSPPRPVETAEVVPAAIRVVESATALPQPAPQN